MIRGAVTELITTFAGQGHSGQTASITLSLFNQLARFRVLTPITSKPEEWVECQDPVAEGTKIWQNLRDSRYFSKDGGQTWWNVDGEAPTPSTDEFPLVEPIREVINERKRQIQEKGHTQKNDDRLTAQMMVDFLEFELDEAAGYVNDEQKRGEFRRQLIKIAAMSLAYIQSLDRTGAKFSSQHD
jgi:hypothetical protein